MTADPAVPARLAIVGAGWSGMAAAVAAVEAGHRVTVFEASRTLGGRARALPVRMPDGTDAVLDNGQHILIGAYTACLRMMRTVGVDLDAAVLRMPLRMRFPDGGGLRLPDAPAPLDALAGIALASGWSLADKMSLLRTAFAWQRAGFACAPGTTVAALCATLSVRVRSEMIDPLCVSALNLPPAQADGQVFLRILQDALFGARGGSHLLLPRTDLGSLFPQPAAHWVRQRGADVRTGQRVSALAQAGTGWLVNGERFDAVVLATAASEAGRLVALAIPSLQPDAQGMARAWSQRAVSMAHTAITTVYAWASGARLQEAMLALRSGPDPAGPAPAQFVFDRGQLGGPAGLLAFVISASTDDRGMTEHHTLEQARAQLGLSPHPLRTITERRATFACTPGLDRPGDRIAPGLRACGDYVAGPYPATLEGAVRAGLAVIR